MEGVRGGFFFGVVATPPIATRSPQTRPRSEVSHTERIDPAMAGFSQLARCRSEIQSAAIGSTDRCRGIVGRKSLDHYRARFSPRSCRCSRANGRAQTGDRTAAPSRRTKARSRFQFGRALATNYSGRRALLHACRCAVDAAARRGVPRENDRRTG